MAIAGEFAYYKPQSLPAAVELLAEHGDAARVLAGGTDLVAWLRDGLDDPRVLVDIKALAGLDQLEEREDGLRIGALVTFNQLIESDLVMEKFPLLGEMSRTVASNGLRNRATLAGNICSAVPSCDGGPVLLVYEAEVLVQGPRGERVIPITDWFTGPKQTALACGELVTGILVPRPGEKHGGAWARLGRYQGEDLAQASVAVLALTGDEYRIAFGAVAPTPVRGRRIESLLAGKTLSAEQLVATRELVPEEISPITDIRATREYRLHMVKLMLERGLLAAADRLAGAGPALGTPLI